MQNENIERLHGLLQHTVRNRAHRRREPCWLKRRSRSIAARIERLVLRTQFEFEVEHRPSEANVADYFSRHPVGSPAKPEETGELYTENYINLVVQNSLPLNISLSEVVESTKKDNQLILLTEWLSKPNVDKLPSELKAFEQHLDKISKTESGILLYENRII